MLFYYFFPEMFRNVDKTRQDAIKETVWFSGITFLTFYRLHLPMAELENTLYKQQVALSITRVEGR